LSDILTYCDELNLLNRFQINRSFLFLYFLQILNQIMDLDPMISSIQEDFAYSDYDDRPIRPMNQEALNETLARLPILIDEDDHNNRTNGSSDSNTSIKARLTNRRQPILAYSTRRKNLPVPASGVNNNQSLLHVNTTIGTPKSNKRKLGGCTPTVTPSANKVIKR
jgi:hypothetical protein